MPDFGVYNFEEIRKNMEKIKQEEDINNGVAIDNSPTTRAPDAGYYPNMGQTESTQTQQHPTGGYMGISSDPQQTEAYKRYVDSPVVGTIEDTAIDNMQSKSWRDYLLSPISGKFILSEGWGKLYNVG